MDMEKIIDSINAIKDGDSITIKIGDIVVTGNASVDSEGKVVITANKPISIFSFDVNNATLTINRGAGLKGDSGFSASISGTYGSNSPTADITVSGSNVKIDNVNGLDNKTRGFFELFFGKEINYPLNKDSFSISNPNEDKRRHKGPDAAGAGVDVEEPLPTPTVSPVEYYTKHDGYTEKNTSTVTPNYAYGATDDPTIHDSNMFHTHVTRRTGNYGEGEKVNLANNPHFDEIISDNASKGRQLFSTKDKSEFSKLDYVAQYAATGQYSVEDLLKSFDALESEGLISFSAHKHTDYWNEDFQNIIDNTLGTDYDALASQLRTDVDFLEKEFSKVHDQMTEWLGSASDAVADAIECILGKFECTMSNISGVLEPACKKIETFKEDLLKLKEGKEKLCGEDGNGGLDKELKDLETALKEKQNALNSIKSREPAKEIWHDGVGNEPGYYEHNNAYDTWLTECTNAQTAVNDAQILVDKKKEEIAKLEVELNKLLEEVLKTYFLVLNLSNTVKSFKQYFTPGTTQNTWISSADNVYKYHDNIIDEFESFEKMPVITSILGYYDLNGEFVDYQIGDLLMHDDAHGYGYKITGIDPKNLSLTVVCVNKDGEEIGDPITIMDPREISTMTYVEHLAEEIPSIKEEYSDYFTPTESEPDPEPIIGVTNPELTPTPSGPTGGNPTPSGSGGANPSGSGSGGTTSGSGGANPPGTGSGGTTSGSGGANPPGTGSGGSTSGSGGVNPPGTGSGGTPSGSGGVNPPGTGGGGTPSGSGGANPPGSGSGGMPSGSGSTPSIAGPGTFGPFGGGIYGTGVGYGGSPYAPHTGLDAIYSANETTNSSAGIAALAALASGVAGLGLTEFFDRKKKKEQEKKEEQEEKNESNKPIYERID